MKRFVLLCLVFCLCGAIFAQDKAAKPAPKKDAKAAAAPSGMPPMPTPGPEIKKLLASVSGNWTATMKSPGVMGMPPSTSVGPASIYPGPGRLSVVETVNSVDEHGNKFSGHGMYWWDAKAGVYKSVWCDNATPTGCADGGNGKWEGDKLVFNGTFDMMGKTYTMKQTTSDFKPDSFMMVMEMGEGSGPLQKAFTVEYKKSAAAAKPAAPAK